MGNGAGQGGFSGGGVHMSMDDIFSQFGDTFEEAPLKVFLEEVLIIEDQDHGSDIRIKMKLSLEEIAKGLEKTIKLKRSVQRSGELKLALLVMVQVK